MIQAACQRRLPIARGQRLQQVRGRRIGQELPSIRGRHRAVEQRLQSAEVAGHDVAANQHLLVDTVQPGLPPAGNERPLQSGQTAFPVGGAGQRQHPAGCGLRALVVPGDYPGIDEVANALTDAWPVETTRGQRGPRLREQILNARHTDPVRRHRAERLRNQARGGRKGGVDVCGCRFQAGILR